MFIKQIAKNGLRMILVPIKGAKTVSVLVAVGVGSKYETKANNGISHFIEHMFFKGTKKRPNTLSIAETMDRVGGSYNAFTGKEYTGYWAKVDHKHIDLALDWVADIFQNSLLPAEEVEREKGVIVQEINMYQDAPMKYVPELFEKLLYGDQPAGWMISGSKENVLRFNRNDLINYRSKYYVSKNTVVCVAGNLSKISMKTNNRFAYISKYFKKLNTSKFENKIPVIEEQTKPEILVYNKQTDQSHFCLGVRAYDLFHPDKYALEALSVLLGGMMSSRIWISLRERKGLAYYVHSQAEQETDTGYLVTQAGVSHQNINEAIKIIINEYKKLIDKKVSYKELLKVKDYIKGSTLLLLEQSDAMASWAVSQEILENKILSPDKVFRKIDAVTPSDIQRVAKDIFQNNKLNLAIICPKNTNLDKRLLNF